MLFKFVDVVLVIWFVFEEVFEFPNACLDVVNLLVEFFVDLGVFAGVGAWLDEHLLGTNGNVWR